MVSFDLLLGNKQRKKLQGLDFPVCCSFTIILKCISKFFCAHASLTLGPAVYWLDNPE